MFAKQNLARHKFRSVLAVIGIVIGVLAMTALGILGKSGFQSYTFEKDG